MAQPGAIYRAVGGALITPFGDNGIVFKVRRGTGTIAATKTIDVSGPSDLGNPTFTDGNAAYSVSLVGEYVEGDANKTGVSYTASTKTLSKTDAFKYANVGQWVYISGGTGSTPGWYQIATKADDNTVTLVESPGASNQTNYTINGFNITSTPSKGPCTVQFGNGETWTGTLLVTSRRLIVDWDNPEAIGMFVSGVFTGPVTKTTGAV